MEIAKLTIKHPHGLHMRPAAKVVRCVQKHRAKVLLCHNCKFADSCSILDMLALGAKQNTEIAVIAEGPDAKKVIKEITELFNEGAGI